MNDEVSNPIVNIILWRAAAGGMEKVIDRTIINLKGQYNFNIFSLRPIPDKEFFFGKTGINVEFGSQNNLIVYCKLIKFTFKHGKSELYHLFNTGPYVLFILKTIGVKSIIYHIHGTIYWKTIYQKVLRKPFWFMGLNRTTRIIANSEYSKKKFHEKISHRVPIDVIYNPFDPPSVQNQLKTNNELSICYSGRLSPEKNLFTWLEVAQTICDRIPTVTFHIYGEGILHSELEKTADLLGINEKVIFHGFVENIEDMYSKHDILMLLSKHESFGNVVIESILAGTPVIAAAIPSMREIFQNYPEFLVNPDKDLSINIIRKLENLQELKLLAEKAKLDFTKKYSLENHLSDLGSVYDKFKE